MMKDKSASYKCYEVPDKKLRKYNTTKREAKKGKYCRPDEKWLVEMEDHAVGTYDEVESNYHPTNNIARDFEEQRVIPTEDNEPE